MNGSGAGVAAAGVAITTAALDPVDVDKGWSGCNGPRFPAPALASCGESMAASELFLDTL